MLRKGEEAGRPGLNDPLLLPEGPGCQCGLRLGRSFCKREKQPSAQAWEQKDQLRHSHHPAVRTLGTDSEIASAFALGARFFVQGPATLRMETTEASLGKRRTWSWRTQELSCKCALTVCLTSGKSLNRFWSQFTNPRSENASQPPPCSFPEMHGRAPYRSFVYSTPRA